MTEIQIRAPRAADAEKWAALWAAYNDFYEQTVPARVTDATWRRILDPASAIGAYVAVEAQADAVLGFAHHVVHPRTWSERGACYLEDLFVAPAARRQGLGRRLIEHLQAVGREQGMSILYWHTRAENSSARALYDRFCEADGHIRYSLDLEASAAREPRVSQ